MSYLADADDRNRLRNIEATEKAKREMLEARSAKPKVTERSKKPNESEESYAGARCTFPSTANSPSPPNRPLLCLCLRGYPETRRSRNPSPEIV